MPAPLLLPMVLTVAGMAALTKRPGEPLFQLPESLRPKPPEKPKEPLVNAPIRALLELACDIRGTNGNSYRSLKDDVRTEILASFSGKAFEAPELGVEAVALFQLVEGFAGDVSALDVVSNAVHNGFAVFVSLSALTEGADVFVMIRPLVQAPAFANPKEGAWALLQDPIQAVAYRKPDPTKLRVPAPWTPPIKIEAKVEPKK